MEPRLIGRGKFQAGSVGDTLCPLLQWSRDLLVAESVGRFAVVVDEA